MRAPEGTPVGSMKRIIISNVIVYNAKPEYGSLIVGIPGHPIEDVKIDLVPLKAKEREITYALTNSFGFGGTNASLLLKRI